MGKHGRVAPIRASVALDVPPGEYAVAVDTDAALPRCSQAQVVVAPGTTIRADIDCDTGIR